MMWFEELQPSVARDARLQLEIEHLPPRPGVTVP